MKRSEHRRELLILPRAAPIVELRRRVHRIEFPVRKNCRMPMKRECRESVQLLLLGKSPVGTEGPAAASKLFKERFALSKFHPLIGAEGWQDRIGIGHGYLGVESGHVELIRQMLAQTPCGAQVTKIQA